MGYGENLNVSNSNLGFQFDFEKLKNSESKHTDLNPKKYKVEVSHEQYEVDQMAAELMGDISPIEEDTETPLMRI